jgi:hypothetical protein
VVSALIAASVAGFVALLALWSDRYFRTRDALSKLLDRFETAGFHVLLWRIEQLTRPSGTKDATRLDRVDADELRTSLDADRRALIELMLGQDWAVQRAEMHEVYAFALQLHAWLVTSLSFHLPLVRERRIRLVNDTFGFQLLSTLLDHRIMALRLAHEADTYYPTQNGCLDPACRTLVDELASELLSDARKWKAPEAIRARLQAKWEATSRGLDALKASSNPMFG